MSTTVEQIKEFPEKHVHKDADELYRCCMVKRAIDQTLVQAHGDFVDMGSNAGTRCDVVSGPCACGAWHDGDARRVIELQLRNAYQAVLREILPDLSPAQNTTLSKMIVKGIHDALKAKPKDREAVRARNIKRLQAWVKKQKKNPPC
ncbi:MAG: hypothetical protein KGI60_02385 [Patescibacteria group bacterium]|nr:hypothetical protein [Patescibacteria group bacterium]